METSLTQVRENYDEMIRAACSQPGVFEVMQLMRNATQQQQTLNLMCAAPLVHVTATSSSLPPANLFAA